MKGPRSGPAAARCVLEFRNSLTRLVIADAIVTFARMETTLLEIVWILEESTLETKRIWPALNNLAKDRNLMVHGFWAVDDAHDDRPVVLSQRFLESEDYVTGEYFDYRRFEFFQKRADHLLNMFRQFRTMLDGLTSEERIAAKLIFAEGRTETAQTLIRSVIRQQWSQNEYRLGPGVFHSGFYYPSYDAQRSHVAAAPCRRAIKRAGLMWMQSLPDQFAAAREGRLRELR